MNAGEKEKLSREADELLASLPEAVVFASLMLRLIDVLESISLNLEGLEQAVKESN